MAINPDHDSSAAPTARPDKLADPQLRAGMLGFAREATHKDKCPLLLQLVTHIALENMAGVVKADSMANW